MSTAPRKRNAPRPADKSASGFLQWLRGRECAVAASGECDGKLQAAHVPGGDAGMGTKASDRFAIPLCEGHHRRQHSTGWETFQAAHRLDAVKAAAAYWQAWPGRIAWERKVDAA